jgi:hypothetical protein
MMKGKRAQIDFPVIGLIVVGFVLLISAPLILKVFNTVGPGMASAYGNMSNGQGTVAQTNVNYVFTTGAGLIDKMAIALFVIACIIMLISAFFVDAHPIFIILYIFVAFLTILFTPHIISVIDTLYSQAALTTEVGQLTYLSFLKDNFVLLILGFIVITGVIIYGKVFLFNSNGGGGATSR